MTLAPLTPPSDADLLRYALHKAADARADTSTIAAALEKVDAGQLPADELTRSAITDAIATLQRAQDALPAIIARLQTLAARDTKELPL